MSRFVVVVDWSGRLDLAATLGRARAVMTLGGSHERAFELERAPFAALTLSHRDEPPREWADGSVALAGGYGVSCDERAEFLRGCRGALERGEPGAPMPALPAGPAGRRSFVTWWPVERQLLLVAEPHGLESVYVLDTTDLTVLSTEVKGIWSVAAGYLTLDVNTLLDLYGVAHCLDGRTLFEQVRCAEAGTASLFGAGGAERRASYHVPRFNEGRRGSAAVWAAALDARAAGVLRAYRRAAPRVSVALSGGLDSRYVLAAARPHWGDLDAFTFGAPDSQDVLTARRLAARAGVRHREYRAGERFLPDWMAYAVWRMDGMLSGFHAQGMDAVIEHTRVAHDLLNGMCGDVVMGSFLRPAHLGPTGGVDRAARLLLATRRFHDRAPRDIFKPEILARAGDATPEDRVRELLGRGLHERLGNTMLAYWLRWYVPRTTVMGLVLETPFAEHWGPLADPDWIAGAAGLPLELRFMCRAYRAALARLSPALMRERWGRTGLAPRWPWPLLALGRAGIRLGVLSRPRPALELGAALRTTLQPWLRGILLADETRADGYFEPRSLEEIVRRHAGGDADLSAELGMALTVELWRRMFVAGRTELVRHPELSSA